MKRASITQAALFILALFATNGTAEILEDPPISGKFFYSQLYEQDYQLYTKTVVGQSEPQQVMHLFPTTSELTIGLFTIICSMETSLDIGYCNVNNFYDHTQDSADNRAAVGVAQEVAHLYQDGKIQENTFSGMEITTNINFTVPSYYRQTLMDDLYMLSIQSLSKNYSSDLMGGYLGMGPYTAIDQLASVHLQKQEVFLYELQDRSHIDHQTVAFYVSSNPDLPSFIKFGSYDRSGFADPDQFNIFKTVNSATWAINAFGTYKLTNSVGESRSAIMGDGGFVTGNVLIDPGFPFFYIPESFFKRIVDTFNGAPISYQGSHFNYERIKFFSKCSDVKPGVTTELAFELTTERNMIEKFTFNLTELLIDGAIFGEEGSCYVGMFPNTNAPYPTMVYAGALFLKKYYTFFDMSGYDPTSQILGQTLRVGIGLKNKDNLILEKQYNKYYEGYAPYMHDQSNFTYTPNKYTYQKMQDPIEKQQAPPQTPENNTMILIISISVVVFLLVVLITMICLRRRMNAKRKLDEYKEQVNDNMRPSDLGDSVFNLNESTDAIKNPKQMDSINQSSQSLNHLQL